jgi:hypothetical protein
MTTYIETEDAINANVKRYKRVDLDAQLTSADVGTVPSAVAATVVATETGDKLWHKTVLTCTSLPLSLADDAGVAQYGGVQVYTLPAGLIATTGAAIVGNLTLGATGTFIDAYTGVNALGTAVASTGATLVSTEATWLQSTANATAATKVAAISSVSVATQVTEAGSRVYDGRATAAPIFLNFAIADDISHTAGTGTFTGTITFVWTKVV